MKTLKITLFALLCTLFLVACEQEGPFERAGESIDEAAEDVGNEIEDACEDVKDAAGAKDGDC